MNAHYEIEKHNRQLAAFNALTEKVRINGATYSFMNLEYARKFVNNAVKPMFIFDAPNSGYIVADARAAKKLFDDGHQDIR